MYAQDGPPELLQWPREGPTARLVSVRLAVWGS